MTKPLPIEKLTSPYKCPMHRMWLRKGQCEICRMVEDTKRLKHEKEMGVQKQEVVIKRV